MGNVCKGLHGAQCIMTVGLDTAVCNGIAQLDRPANVIAQPGGAGLFPNPNQQLVQALSILSAPAVGGHQLFELSLTTDHSTRPGVGIR